MADDLFGGKAVRQQEKQESGNDIQLSGHRAKIQAANPTASMMDSLTSNQETFQLTERGIVAVFKRLSDLEGTLERQNKRFQSITGYSVDNRGEEKLDIREVFAHAVLAYQNLGHVTDKAASLGPSRDELKELKDMVEALYSRVKRNDLGKLDSERLQDCCNWLVSAEELLKDRGKLIGLMESVELQMDKSAESVSADPKLDDQLASALKEMNRPAKGPSILLTERQVRELNKGITELEQIFARQNTKFHAITGCTLEEVMQHRGEMDVDFATAVIKEKTVAEATEEVMKAQLDRKRVIQMRETLGAINTKIETNDATEIDRIRMTECLRWIRETRQDLRYRARDLEHLEVMKAATAFRHSLQSSEP